MAELTRIFVYGTLRNGETNHARYLSGAQFEKKSTVRGFQMFALAGYPFVLKSVGSLIQTESYLIDAQTLARIDLLELFLGEGHPENEYNRVEVENEFGDKGFLYVYADENLADKRYPIDDGNWPKYREINQFGFCS